MNIINSFTKHNLYKSLVPLLYIILSFPSCRDCEWDYSKNDFEFTENELLHLEPYKIGDTIFFENSLGNIDTVAILKTEEERQEGRKCIISIKPSHFKGILGEDTVRKSYIVSVVKYPLNKEVTYAINFRNFTWHDSSFSHRFQKEIIIDNKSILNCYKLEHSYPNRIVNPDDISVIYWTDKYGLTAYTQKNGITWVIRRYDNVGSVTLSRNEK